MHHFRRWDYSVSIERAAPISLSVSCCRAWQNILHKRNPMIQVELNGKLVEVTKHQLFALAARGNIGPETRLIFNGKESTVGKIKGIEFGGESIETPVPSKENYREQPRKTNGLFADGKNMMNLFAGIGIGGIILVVLFLLFAPNKYVPQAKRPTAEATGISIAVF